MKRRAENAKDNCDLCPKYVAKDLFLRTRVATTRSWSIFLLLSSTLPKIKTSVFHRPRASQYLRCSTTFPVELISSSWGGKERNGQTSYRLIFFMQNLKEVAGWPTTSNLSCAVSNMMLKEGHLALHLIHKKKTPKYLKPNCITIILITPSSEYMYVSCKQVYLRVRLHARFNLQL